MKNKKIHFQKLVDLYCPYSSSEKLQILEWMFKDTSRYDVRCGRWHVDGVDKIIYDYSANSHKAYTKIEDWRHVRLMFINAIIPTVKFQKWREDRGINLGAVKFLNFKIGSNNYLRFNQRGIFEIIDLLKGAKLKKEFFHPDYPNRNNPFIYSIKFTISEKGCHIFLDFTFDECEGASWTKEFWKRDESMEDFFLNSFQKIDSWLITPQIL